MIASTIYKWQNHQPVSKDKRKSFFHKIDPELLKQDIEQYPDDYQSERAARYYPLSRINDRGTQ
ncbi:IS630 transposase-related protein [Stenoxybacter acetivorans]|uniref:IS630 transposase-related protein n=1 Tax=Stenoxybacter acetivorans TaxID=422441 RepID=UPI00056666EA|nr:IS630 transposase-related protein [Stenoxybacter acetivorans]